MATDSPQKKHFLVVYDYGMGGLWAVIAARSEKEIISKFPELNVIRSRPVWMNDAEYAKIVSQNYLDIDSNGPKGWLEKL